MSRNLETTLSPRRADRRPNVELRQEVQSSGVKHWEICQTLGISESTWYRILRSPLTEAQTAAVRQLLKEIRS